MTSNYEFIKLKRKGFVKKSSTIKNDSAFSFLEVMVVAGLMSNIGLAITSGG